MTRKMANKKTASLENRNMMKVYRKGRIEGGMLDRNF